jgi:hypothetical protein
VNSVRVRARGSESKVEDVTRIRVRDPHPSQYQGNGQNPRICREMRSHRVEGREPRAEHASLTRDTLPPSPRLLGLPHAPSPRLLGIGRQARVPDSARIRRADRSPSQTRLGPRTTPPRGGGNRDSCGNALWACGVAATNASPASGQSSGGSPPHCPTPPAPPPPPPSALPQYYSHPHPSHSQGQPPRSRRPSLTPPLRDPSPPGPAWH